MVLKNSKYDKQATKAYQVKHGLLKRPEKVVRPKWSSKKVKHDQSVMKLDIDEMTSDWDSECDEDIVEYFYPSMGEELQEMTIEMKRKIKRQVIEDLKLQRDEMINSPQEVQEQPDGIYLGKETPKVELKEFIPTIPITKRKTRKLPINNEESHLNEYGISYSETVTNKDYDEVYKKKLASRKLEDIPTSELIGFKIGQDMLGDNKQNSRPVIRTLTEDEKRENEALQAKNAQHKSFQDMKKKFSGQPRSKVLELNNYDNSNQQHRDYLNGKLTQQDEEYDIEEDLSQLLGGFKLEKEPENKQQDFLDELLGL